MYINILHHCEVLHKIIREHFLWRFCEYNIIQDDDGVYCGVKAIKGKVGGISF